MIGIGKLNYLGESCHHLVLLILDHDVRLMGMNVNLSISTAGFAWNMALALQLKNSDCRGCGCKMSNQFSGSDLKAQIKLWFILRAVLIGA